MRLRDLPREARSISAGDTPAGSGSPTAIEAVLRLHLDVRLYDSSSLIAIPSLCLLSQLHQIVVICLQSLWHHSRVTLQRPMVIAGAGIAGLTLAAALSKHKVDVVVLERSSNFPEVGAGISLWPNAMAALDSIGVGNEVREAGGAFASGGVQRPDGSWIRSVESKATEKALGEPMLAVHRKDLMRILASHVRDGALRFDSELNRFDVAGDGVRAHLEDGRTVEGTAIVGADGINSTIAKWLDPALLLSYSGYTAWRGIASISTSDFPPSETWGMGCEFGFVPIGPDRTYWFATENVAEGLSSPEGERQHLLAKFGHWHDPIPSLMAATSDLDVLRHDICDRTPISTWSKGPVVVIGDAAHPMRPHLGQGGCQAIEDGVLLSMRLGPDSDAASVFSEFARDRARRTKSIVRQSAMIGRAIQGEGWTASTAKQIGARIPMGIMIGNLSQVGSRAAFDRAAIKISNGRFQG
jgi:2-polyprenyl-6-methoxyphenol hydroxylase-like FAD-dependent oxidoreductase